MKMVSVLIKLENDLQTHDKPKKRVTSEFKERYMYKYVSSMD